jgi:alpha-L-rhamnosidase
MKRIGRLGQYELSLNGAKIGDDLLSPGWSKYDKTCLYDTYDLAPLLKQGARRQPSDSRVMGPTAD